MSVGRAADVGAMSKLRFRWSMAWMIALTTEDVVALSVGATVALDVGRGRAAAVAELKERAELLVSHMGDMAAKPLGAEDDQALRDVAHMLVSLPDVEQVRLVGADGRVFVTMDGHGGSTDMGSMDTGPMGMGSMDMNRGEAAARALATHEPVLLLGGEHLSVARPVVVGGGLVGVAQLDLDLSSLDEPAEELALARVLEGSVLLAIAVLVSYALAQYLARPIRRLAAAARGVADGDLDFTETSGRSDEIGDLATAFSDMTRSLREAQDTAQRSTASLTEKEALLKEIHHRVKNNLQMISSLLSLQVSASDDPEAIAALEESEPPRALHGPRAREALPVGRPLEDRPWRLPRGAGGRSRPRV